MNDVTVAIEPRMLALCSCLLLAAAACGSDSDEPAGSGGASGDGGTSASTAQTGADDGAGSGGGSGSGDSAGEDGGDGADGGTGADDGGAPGEDPLEALSDDFEDPTTLDAWRLASDADDTEPAHVHLAIAGGTLELEPASTGWYDRYRGPLLFKLVEGDFVAETELSVVAASDLVSAPTLPFNSAGLMVDDPAEGAENWVTYNVGFQLDSIATEGKTTVDSESTLYLIDDTHRGRLRICRIGDEIILAKRFAADDAWIVQHVFVREDLPNEVRVGMMANGWNSTDEQPDTSIPADVRGIFEYVSFRTPTSAADCLE